MPRRSCATCRDRRILCDRADPPCGQCTTSNRECKGYDFRLFWPGPDNTKRALSVPSLQSPTSFSCTVSGLVNVSAWDIELHERLKAGSQSDLEFVPPKPFNTIENHVPEHELLRYFQSTASTCLATFGHTPTDLGQLLMVSALFNESSSRAVRHSILAFSSRHLDGLRPQAANNKIDALKSLQGSSPDQMPMKEAVQHVATHMMLCTFETYNASCTAGQWETYLHNAKDIIRSSALASLKDEDRLTPLLDWVYYHDVLSRFTRIHWKRTQSSDDESPHSQQSYRPPTTNPPLLLLSELLDFIALQASSGIPHQEHIKILAFRIRKGLPPCGLGSQSKPGHDYSKPTSSPSFSFSAGSNCSSRSSPSSCSGSSTVTNLTCHTANADVVTDSTKNVSTSDCTSETQTHLLHTAMLIYLYRSEENNPSSSSSSTCSLIISPADLQALQKHIFKILLPSLDSYANQFALFILGSEARSDSERVAVLDLLERTEDAGSSRDTWMVRKMVETFWVQVDLDLVDAAATGGGRGRGKGRGKKGGAGKGAQSENEDRYQNGYLDKVTGVVSCCPFMPSFA